MMVSEVLSSCMNILYGLTALDVEIQNKQVRLLLQAGGRLRGNLPTCNRDLHRRGRKAGDDEIIAYYHDGEF